MSEIAAIKTPEQLERRTTSLAVLVDEGLAMEEKGWRQVSENLWKIRQAYVGDERPIKNTREARAWIAFAKKRFPALGERAIRHRTSAWETINNISYPAGKDTDERVSTKNPMVREIFEKVPQESLRGLSTVSHSKPEEVHKALAEAIESKRDKDRPEPTKAEVDAFVKKHLPDLKNTPVVMPLRRALNIINDIEVTPKEWAKLVHDNPVTRDKVMSGIGPAITFLTILQKELEERYG